MNDIRVTGKASPAIYSQNSSHNGYVREGSMGTGEPIPRLRKANTYDWPMETYILGSVGPQMQLHFPDFFYAQYAELDDLRAAIMDLMQVGKQNIPGRPSLRTDNEGPELKMIFSDVDGVQFFDRVMDIKARFKSISNSTEARIPIFATYGSRTVDSSRETRNTVFSWAIVISDIDVRFDSPDCTSGAIMFKQMPALCLSLDDYYSGAISWRGVSDNGAFLIYTRKDNSIESIIDPDPRPYHVAAVRLCRKLHEEFRRDSVKLTPIGDRTVSAISDNESAPADKATVTHDISGAIVIRSELAPLRQAISRIDAIERTARTIGLSEEEDYGKVASLISTELRDGRISSALRAWLEESGDEAIIRREIGDGHAVSLEVNLEALTSATLLFGRPVFAFSVAIGISLVDDALQLDVPSTAVMTRSIVESGNLLEYRYWADSTWETLEYPCK